MKKKPKFTNKRILRFDILECIKYKKGGKALQSLFSLLKTTGIYTVPCLTYKSK